MKIKSKPGLLNVLFQNSCLGYPQLVYWTSEKFLTEFQNYIVAFIALRLSNWCDKSQMLPKIEGVLTAHMPFLYSLNLSARQSHSKQTDSSLSAINLGVEQSTICFVFFLSLKFIII